MHPDVRHAFEEIDAGIFSSDPLDIPEDHHEIMVGDRR
jgi:hypothetical protein